MSRAFTHRNLGECRTILGVKKTRILTQGGPGGGPFRGGASLEGGVGSKMVPSGPYFWGSFFGVFGPITPTCRHPKSDFYDFFILFSYFLLIKSIILYEIFMKIY